MGLHPIISVGLYPQVCSVGSILTKNCVGILERVLGLVGVKKKTQENRLNVNKDLEGLTYISDLNHLFTALLIHDTRTSLQRSDPEGVRWKLLH